MKIKLGSYIKPKDINIIRSWGEEIVIAIVAIHRLGREKYLEKDDYVEFKEKCKVYSYSYKQEWILEHEI